MSRLDAFYLWIARWEGIRGLLGTFEVVTNMMCSAADILFIFCFLRIADIARKIHRRFGCPQHHGREGRRCEARHLGQPPCALGVHRARLPFSAACSCISIMREIGLLQSNSHACDRAAMRTCADSRPASRSMASAMPDESGLPHSPQREVISSLAPPRSEVTTGVPQASASSTARPKVSVGLTDSEISEQASLRATSSRPATKPWKWTGA